MPTQRCEQERALDRVRRARALARRRARGSPSRDRPRRGRCGRRRSGTARRTSRARAPRGGAGSRALSRVVAGHARRPRRAARARSSSPGAIATARSSCASPSSCRPVEEVRPAERRAGTLVRIQLDGGLGAPDRLRRCGRRAAASSRCRSDATSGSSSCARCSSAIAWS